MQKEIVRDVEILSKPCDAVTAEDAELVQDLLDTLEAQEDAACIAANQIGVTKRAGAYLDDAGEAHVLLNPTMKRALYPIRTVEECISLDGESKVTRYGKIHVIYDEIVDGELVSRKRDFQGNEAQAIQHMIDHCKGKLV